MRNRRLVTGVYPAAVAPEAARHEKSPVAQTTGLSLMSARRPISR